MKNTTTGETYADCVPCPNGTMVIGDASSIMTVEQACRSCPPGLVPGVDEECLIDLEPTTSANKSYDFRELFESEFTTESAKLFTSQGQEFYQFFKLFVNTREPKSRSACINDNKMDVSLLLC